MQRPLQQEGGVVQAARRYLDCANSGRHVAEAMASLVATTSRLSLANLENWERKLRAELFESEWTSSSTRWKFWKRPTRSLSWLDLCSGDGFRRERTLRTLSEGAPNGFFCLLTLRRLNDWVPEVRAAARQHLPIIAERSDAQYVVDALWNALPHCISWGRMGDPDREVLTHLISIESVAVMLKSRIVSAASGPATSILSQTGRAPALDRWLSEIATNAIQPSVRARAYRCLIEGRTVWVVGRKWVWTDLRWCKGRFEQILEERSISGGGRVAEVLKMALLDRSPIVRRVAGDMLIQQWAFLGAECRDLADLLASDPFPSLAERGRFVLSRLSGSI